MPFLLNMNDENNENPLLPELQALCKRCNGGENTSDLDSAFTALIEDFLSKINQTETTNKPNPIPEQEITKKEHRLAKIINDKWRDAPGTLF